MFLLKSVQNALKFRYILEYNTAETKCDYTTVYLKSSYSSKNEHFKTAYKACTDMLTIENFECYEQRLATYDQLLTVPIIDLKPSFTRSH